LISQLTGAIVRAVLVVILIATPSIMLPGIGQDSAQIVALISIFAARLTIFEYAYLGGVFHRQADVVVSTERTATWAALVLTVCTGLLMVSRFSYYSFKDIDLRERVPFVTVVAMVHDVLVTFVLILVDSEILGPHAQTLQTGLCFAISTQPRTDPSLFVRSTPHYALRDRVHARRSRAGAARGDAERPRSRSDA